MQNSKRILIFALISIALHFFTSCNDREKPVSKEEPAAPSSGPVTSWPATRSSTNGSFEITLNPGDGKIVQHKHFTLDVTLKAKKDELDDVTVVVDADMPAHQHGMNTKPQLTKKSPSEFKVEGMLFHMGGDWEITVDVKRDGKTERASFPVTIE